MFYNLFYWRFASDKIENTTSISFIFEHYYILAHAGLYDFIIKNADFVDL